MGARAPLRTTRRSRATLTARRAFFFFDDAVVGLGVNVTGRAALPVRTALVTRALPDARADPRGAVLLGFANGSTAALADAAEPSFFAPGELAFVAAGGLVALLPAAAASRARVGVSVGNVTGNWETIGAFSGNVTRRMLTAFLDHGVAPAGEAFAYVLAPNVSAADAGAAAAAGAGVACVTNGLDAQGAADVRGGLLAAVVWAPRGAALTCAAAFPPSGAPLALATDRDAAVLVRVNATHLVVSAAHPAAAAGGAAVHVTVSRAARAAPGCAPDGAASTVVTLALPPAGPFLGATTTVTCALV
jgi:hyaluronate lyase